MTTEKNIKHKKVNNDIAPYIEKILNRSNVKFTKEKGEESYCIFHVEGISHNEWQYFYEDAVALREEEETHSPFPVLSYRTATNFVKLKQLGLTDKTFLISTKDQDKVK